MKKRKFFVIFLILISYLGLASCLGIDGNIISTIKSNIYRGSLSSSGSIITYFLKNNGDVPFVDFIDTTKSIIGRDIAQSSSNSDGYKVLRTDNNAYMLVNATNDTIYFSNYEAFVSKSKSGTTFDPKSSTYSYSNTNSSEETQTSAVTFNLANYNIDIVESKDVIYVPFQIFDTLIYSQMDISIAFNGHDYYAVSSSSYFTNRNYYISYFSGRSQSGNRSSYMANFTYNHLMFALDYYFSIKETRGISSFNELCETEGIKDDLLNTSSETFNKALNNLIYTYLDDGHSGFIVSSNYLTYDANADSKYSDSYTGTRRKALQDSHNSLSSYRQASRGFSFITSNIDSIYNYSGNTLIISIDSFNFPVSDYYKQRPNSRTYSDDSFAILYYALNTYIPSYEKSKGQKITNIIIDVTLNGGGYVDDCIGLLGFLSNNYYVEYENSASGDISKINYTVDTNLDGSFNSDDGYQGKYNFYILTSNYSFSCANMLATICQNQNLATIIGEETAGGGGIVYNLCLADSTAIKISGNHSLIYHENDQIYYSENKIKPDYEIAREFMYSPTYLNTFVNSLN